MPLEKFDKQDFLENFWQQRPLYIPSLLAAVDLAISPEELAGLACEEFVESRLVKRVAGPEPQTLASTNWYLKHGPFQEADFLALKPANWTLLVQAVDLWLDQAASLKQAFDFIPSWRIDDIMVSYATDGGGVGPHFDYYDVFLVQGAGIRLWQIGAQCSPASKLRADSDLCLLDEFVSEQTYLLKQGDVLYIPPGYSHYGVSQGDSICYSVGFRSPSLAEQLQGFTELLLETVSEQERFIDTHSAGEFACGEIARDTLQSPLNRIKSLIDNPQAFTEWFGCHVTSLKYPELSEYPEQTFDIAQSDLLQVTVVKNPHSRFAWTRYTANELMLFVDGVKFTVAHSNPDQLIKLCEKNEFREDELKAIFSTHEMKSVLTELLNCGSLIRC